MSTGRLFSNRDRPFDMGVLPTELLPRDGALPVVASAQPGDRHPAAQESILEALPEYRALFRQFLDGEPSRQRAPVAEDPLARARNLKASAYFLDATLAGVCLLERGDWVEEARAAHTHAFVFLIEFGREPKPREPGDAWIRGTNAARTDLRYAEIAVVHSG